jgi:MFS family permease
VILRPVLLYAVALLMNSSTGVMVVATPLLAIRFGANPLELGLLGSLGALVYTLTCPFSGRYSDGFGGSAGRRRSILLACCLLILTDVCIFFVGNLRDIFILAVCGCFSTAFFWPPLQAWLAEVGYDRGLSQRLGSFNLSWSLGIMIGPVIGGYLFGLDYRYPWCYGVSLNILIVTLLLCTNVRVERPVDPGDGTKRVPTDGAPAGFWGISLWANFVCWFSLANVQSIYPKLASMRGFSPELIGYLLFLIGALETVTFFMLRRSSFWHYRYLPLAFVHGAAACGMLLIFGSKSISVLSCAFPLLGLGLGLSYYSSIYYGLSGRQDRGRRTGIHEFIVGSGFLVGPVTGGACAQFIGLRSPFLLCALLMALTAAVEGLLYVRVAVKAKTG